MVPDGFLYMLPQICQQLSGTQPEDPSVRVWISDDKVIIKGSVSEKAICEIYDLRGQKVLMTHLADGELNIVNMNSTPRGRLSGQDC